MIFGGIDVGSRAIKTVLWDNETQKIVAMSIKDQGVAQDKLASQAFDELLHGVNLSRKDITGIVATGYGRNLIPWANTAITEITCHAHGVCHLLPETRTIIEIGGQDSKIIRLEDHGTVRDFSMNDRCAAGCGRFLEVVANRMQVSLPELAKISKKSRHPVSISSMCVVFAETEIIGLLANGALPADIVAGVFNAMASRTAAMAGRTVEAPICFTGGVALIPGMQAALSEILEREVSVCPHPLYTGALGAALIAAHRFSKTQ
jgi:predicted CoA-substrate-specific enzyme activase